MVLNWLRMCGVDCVKGDKMTFEQVALVVAGLPFGFAVGSLLYVTARGVYILRRVGFDE